MMKLYTIYDKVTEEAAPIFEARTDNAAMRMLQQTKFPEGFDRNDFDLYCLGAFDREKMLIFPKDKARLIRGINTQTDGENENEDV